MIIEKDIYKTYTPDFDKFLAYGFQKCKSGYKFEKLFFNGEFKASVFVSLTGDAKGEVLDVQNEDEFLPLRIVANEGSFVASVKEEYEKLLIDIRDNCFSKRPFVTSQANRISDIIYKTYGDKPVFMWAKFPTFGVFKNSQSDKWYGLIMYIERSKLGEKSNNFAEVMNLKSDRDKISELHQIKGIYPAYHMNKKYWISVILDDTLCDDDIMKLIDDSYKFTCVNKK